MVTSKNAAPAEMRLNEKALEAAIVVGSNMAGEHLVRQIVAAYLAALHDHIPEAGKMVDAPTEMPTREQVEAEILPMTYDCADLTECVERVLALFAPKAEKPPTLTDDAASSEIAVQLQPRIGAKRAETILPPADELDQWKARALAAEAALAAERERCIAIVDAQVPDWVKERSGPYWDGYREAMEDAAEDMRKGVPARAAAIRAEGE